METGSSLKILEVVLDRPDAIVDEYFVDIVRGWSLGASWRGRTRDEMAKM